MELSLQVIPVGNATHREIAAAAQDLHNAVERLQGVARIEAVQEPTPDQGKGVGAVLGTLLISVAPAALRAFMQAVKTVLAPHPPTKIVIETKGGKFRFEFDPKTVDLQDLVAAADRLRAAAPKA